MKEGAVYIGRGSKYGNPYVIGTHGNREEVIRKYWLKLDADCRLKAEAIADLAGKDLVCYCAPQKCHGDILLHLANTGEMPPCPPLIVTPLQSKVVSFICRMFNAEVVAIEREY